MQILLHSHYGFHELVVVFLDPSRLRGDAYPQVILDELLLFKAEPEEVVKIAHLRPPVLELVQLLEQPLLLFLLRHLLCAVCLLRLRLQRFPEQVLYELVQLSFDFRVRILEIEVTGPVVYPRGP